MSQAIIQQHPRRPQTRHSLPHWSMGYFSLDLARLVGKVCQSIKPGGLLYLAEPVGHVSRELFAWEEGLIWETGLVPVERPKTWRQMNTVFRKA